MAPEPAARDEAPAPALEDVKIPEAVWDEEPLQETAEAPEEETDDLGESEPVGTEVWDSDGELEQLLKSVGVEEKVEPDLEGLAAEAETPEAETPAVEEPPMKPADTFGLGAEQGLVEPAEPPSESRAPDEELAMQAAVAAAMATATQAAWETQDRPLRTSLEHVEEKTMEERPAMFQPMLEILEKRLQIMVQKAVQEQLPGIVRRVLQEEIERLSKNLG